MDTETFRSDQASIKAGYTEDVQLASRPVNESPVGCKGPRDRRADAGAGALGKAKENRERVRRLRE